MITGHQIRKALALLNWERWRLAKKSGVSVTVITRAEIDTYGCSITPEQAQQIKAALEAADIEFLDNGPSGVRLLQLVDAKV